MRRLLVAAAFLAALAVPAAASAWEGVAVFVTFPERATAGGTTLIDFHVMLGGKPLDLSRVGPRDPRLLPRVVFRKRRQEVTAVARRTANVGVYRVAVVLPATGGWSYTFEYGGLVRSFPRVTVR